MRMLVMFLMIISSTLSRRTDLKLRGAASPACGCQCSSLVWQDDYGKVQGNCRSADHTKAKWCYVKEGSTCSDLVPSARHPRNPWSYQACATPTQAQCASGSGGFTTSGRPGPSRQPNNGAFGSNGYDPTHSSSGDHSSQQSQGQFSSAFGSSGGPLAGLLSSGSSGYGAGVSSGSSSRPQGFGSSVQNGVFESSGHNGGFGSSGHNGGFGSSGQNGGFGSSGQSGGFGSSGQSGGFGSSGQNGAFGSSGHSEGFETSGHKGGSSGISGYSQVGIGGTNQGGS